jgi:probable F420-dependent oxidoreductase
MVTDESMPLLDLARETEARGLSSIFLPEHTHMPLESEILVSGFPYDPRYARAYDPWIAASWITAMTSLEVGTGVALPHLHDPIVLAKQLATLDHLSGGRIVLGVGAGYLRQEIEDHGVPAEQRLARLEEAIALMRALWTEEVASFEGDHFSMSPSWSWPKPARPGGLPVLLGGRATPATFRRICAWGDGWLPAGITVRGEEMAQDLGTLRRAWADAGRGGQPEISCFFLAMAQDQIAAELDTAAELGIGRVQAFVGPSSREEVLPVLDLLGEAVAAR